MAQCFLFLRSRTSSAAPSPHPPLCPASLPRGSHARWLVGRRRGRRVGAVSSGKLLSCLPSAGATADWPSPESGHSAPSQFPTGCAPPCREMPEPCAIVRPYRAPPGIVTVWYRFGAEGQLRVRRVVCALAAQCNGWVILSEVLLFILCNDLWLPNGYAVSARPPI